MPRRKHNARIERRRPLPRKVTGYSRVKVGRQLRSLDDHRPGVVVAIGEWVTGGVNRGKGKQ